MFKCLNCGHLFDEGEQAVAHDRHGFRFGSGEEYSACPVCGGTDLEATVRCRKCGGEYLEADMHGSFCYQCVSDYVNRDTFLEYATSGAKHSDEPDVLEDFVFRMLFDVRPAEQTSFEMKQEFKRIYLQRAESEKLMRTTDLTYKILDYMKDPSTFDDFAEWMEQKEATK